MDYLNERDPSLWSYVDFLTTNRTVIVNSLPHLVDHKGLDGAWTKRFILSIKDLSSDLVGDMESLIRVMV